MEFTKLTDIYSTFPDVFKKRIVWNEKNKKYYVFTNVEELEKWYMIQEEKYYHEVIFGQQNQRLKIDIDIIKQEGFEPNILFIIDTIIQVIEDLYYEIDDISLTYKDFIITDSSGLTDKGYKYSYHIILFTCAFNNYNEVKYITECIIKKIPNYGIDIQVNKSVQNFRLLLSTKLNSTRIKQISHIFTTNKDVSFTDTLIVPFLGIYILPVLCEDLVTEAESRENDEYINKILSIDKVIDITDGHTIRDCKNNCINFNRVKPTYCNICNEIHHNDNSLIIQYFEDIIYEYCRQANKNRYVCSITNDDIEIKTNIESNKFISLSNKNIYNLNVMKEYELVETLVIHAQMKIGKTKKLHEHVSKYFKESSICFVSFRQTFSNHIYNQFNEFELYLNIKGYIDQTKHKKVIIQVESLYRLGNASNKLESVDLLILDEVESIISQLGSGLHKNFNASFSMFIWLIKTSKYVICMDANISNRTYNIIQKFRSGNIFYHCNQWQTSKEDIYYITNTKNKWINHLFTKISEDKKIVIPTNSIMEAKTCELLISHEFPSKKIKLYSSETKYSEKQLHFNNVNKYWSDLDVLIYTPTCSAGISYELEHYDYVFGYFCNTSCDVETCRQMIGRVRNIRSKEYYIYLSEIEMPILPHTSDELHEYLYNKRLAMNYIDNNLSWSYDQMGNMKFYETDYYYIWLENTVLANISKNNFKNKFCNQIIESGATIKQLDFIQNRFVQEHTDARKEIEDKQNTDIANAIDLSNEEIEEIRTKIDKQLDISTTEYLSYEKFKLRKIYNYSDIIKPDFVKWYKPKHIQRIYKNLCDISSCSTIEQSIELLRKKENERYSSIISNTSSYKNKLEYHDLNNDQFIYTSLLHMIISKFIVLLGVEPLTLNEYKQIVTDDITPILNTHEKFLTNELKCVINPDRTKLLNKLLKTMYGFRMYKTGNIVQLKRSDSLFTFSKIKKKDCVYICTNNELFLKL
jgi:hypothetical protein